MKDGLVHRLGYACPACGCTDSPIYVEAHIGDELLAFYRCPECGSIIDPTIAAGAPFVPLAGGPAEGN